MNKNKGFTLIELLVVIAIIGVLSTIVLAVLSSTRGKTNDAKIKSQLKSMVPQSQLFTGAVGTSYIVPSGTSPVPSSISGGTLFNDTVSTHYSLYNLLSKLPPNTSLYYGWDGSPTLSGGKWFVSAGISQGAVCIDSIGTLRSWIGTTPTTTAEFITAFPTAKAHTYSCQ